MSKALYAHVNLHASHKEFGRGPNTRIMKGERIPDEDTQAEAELAADEAQAAHDAEPTPATDAALVETKRDLSRQLLLRKCVPSQLQQCQV